MACGLVVALAACGSTEDRVDDYMAQGSELLAQGDLQRAALSFRNVLKIEPRHAPALLAMGRIHEQRENYPKAFAAYREAASADPALLEAHVAYAILALTGGQLDVVAEAIEAIRAAEPDNAHGLALAAALALREEQLAKAEDLARRALAVDPAHVNATSALAGVHRAAGRTDEAVAVLDGYFAEHGGNVPLALLKVQLLAAETDIVGVTRAFEELIEFAPDNADFRIAFADYHRARGDVGAAQRLLGSAIDELDAPPAVAASLVRLIHENAGLDAAIAELDRLEAQRGDPDHVLGFLAADLYTRAERFDEAEERLERVVEATTARAPRSLDARTAMASVARARGDGDAARAHLAEILEIDPDHRGANYLQGVMDLAAGEARSAIAAGRTALASDGDWPPALKLIAEAYRAAGDRELAIDALGRALQAAPDDVEAASALATLLAQQGDYDAALQAWDLVIHSAPDPTPALASAAELAIRQEDWNRAGTEIDRLLATPGAELSGTLLAGSMRLAQGDVEGAQAWYEQAAELDPSGPAPLLGQVRTRLAADDVEGALALLDARIGVMPDDALAHQLQAQLYLRQDDAARAFDAYLAAIDAAPQWATPYLELATLAQGRGQVDEALAILDGGIAADAEPDVLRLRKAFVQQGADRFADAIVTYGALIEGGNDDDIVINNYGALIADFAHDDPMLLARARDLAQRFEVSREAYLVDTLGWLHYRAGDHSAALGNLRRAVAMRPDDPQLRYHYGTALGALGETASAVAELEKAVVDGASYPGLDEAQRLLRELRAILAEGSAS